MAIKKFTAFIFFNDAHLPKNQRKVYKYRNITNRKSLEAYCMSKLDAWYINYYDKETKEFINRVYLKHISDGNTN